MAKVVFQLVMPEREVLATEADMVVVPGSEGDFGVLHGHAPLISTVRPGVLEVLQGNKVEQRFLVVGGFAEAQTAAYHELVRQQAAFLAQYRIGGFVEALDLIGGCEAAAAAVGWQQGYYAMMAERIDELIADPPANWTGVYVATEK